jgi:hypothetical protein
LLLIGQHLVCLAYAAEALGCVEVIRMGFRVNRQGQATVGTNDLFP